MLIFDVCFFRKSLKRGWRASDGSGISSVRSCLQPKLPRQLATESRNREGWIGLYFSFIDGFKFLAFFLAFRLATSEGRAAIFAEPLQKSRRQIRNTVNMQMFDHIVNCMRRAESTRESL
jgi:hypothetical protein